MITRSLFAAALACATLAAQTPPCISLNDTNNNAVPTITAFAFSGPMVSAYQFTSSTPLLLRAAQIYTGNTVSVNRGYLTLEIWDESIAGLPGTRLGGGTWQVQNSLGNGWHGASFDQFVVVNASQNYWIVWREASGNQVPHEPGGVTMPYARFMGGAWVLQATPQALKWRGYCSLLDAQGVLPIGVGCLSSQNLLPSEFTNQAPTIGNADFQLEASGLPPGSIGLAVLGTNPLWTSVQVPGAPIGCELHTDALALSTVFVGTGNQNALHSVGASGHVFFDFGIPPDPTLVGTAIGSQFAVFDVALPAALPFVFTNGLRYTLY